MGTELVLNLKDFIFLGALLFSIAGIYYNVRSNNKKIDKLEVKSDKYAESIAEIKILIVNTKVETLNEMRAIIKDN